jgi:large subunit ribosomal protein L29
MKLSEIRALSTDAIRAEVNDAKEELMRLRFQQATGELTDTSRLRQTRRNIARFYTILNERERNPESEAENE